MPSNPGSIPSPCVIWPGKTSPLICVITPSMSLGVSPASVRAAWAASRANPRYVRPGTRPCSVYPTPAMHARCFMPSSRPCSGFILSYTVPQANAKAPSPL